MLSLAVPCAGGAPRLHAARDAEDEAMRAAACVLAHLAAGRAPVALVAQDRVLTRRVRALLDGQGVVMRDETGWKLSTTRAAASVMGLLRANTGAPTADVVLDWLKHSPAFDAGEVAALEAALRRRGGSHWRVALGSPALESLAQEIREVMQASRTLSQWLAALASVLERAGQWSGLMADRAGQAVVQALRLSKDAWQEFSDLEARMSPPSFIAWVDQTLEAASYLPDHPRQAEVIILPLSQLLGRPLGAVVLPGCDELRLPVSPDPGGAWTPAQTQLLGLPLREALTRAMRSAWDYALGYDQVDLLWRQSDAGDSVMASGFVLELLLKGAGVMADDPCLTRDLAQRSAAPPAPGAAALAPQRLSSTAYEDLRRCPYRFFALRQLALQEDEELESEVDKRDFGNWLHATLRYFHEALIQRPDADLTERRRMIDSAADRVTSEQDLPADEFLPFAAAWPNLREGYLKWLTAHESTGAKFIQAEVGKTLPLGPVMLVGQLDRLDRLADGSPMVMDYKTESRQVTQARISQGSEDTQIAFYAALMQEDTVQGSLSGAYISVTEREGTKTLTPPDIQGLRELLLRGLAQDMEGIAQGRPLPALGHGEACDYCAARGLCRRDFWEQSALGPLPSADGTASEGLQHV